MCFSASVSFGAGAVLAVAGVLTLNRVKTSTQYVFATIPMFFAIQQFSEGLVWLSLSNPNFSTLEPMATVTFLIFAQVVWPVWVPLSIVMLEQNAKRKKILFTLLAMGATLSLYLGYCLMTYPVKASIVSYHIDYSLSFPLAFIWISGLFYFIPTVVSPLISSRKRVPLLGLAILASYFFTKIFYTNYVISVWCFFAAIISIIVLFIITEINKTPEVEIEAEYVLPKIT